MPLVNVIRGDALPPSMVNLRTPAVRIPLWAAVTWWTVKGFTRLCGWYARHWYVTVPMSLLLWLYLDAGWLALAALAGGLIALGFAWWYLHRATFLRLAGWPLLARWRRLVYARSWHSAMATAGLAVSWDGQRILPELRRVRRTSAGDVVTVKMVTGQIPDDYAKASLRLAHTFGARACRVIPGRRPEYVTLVLRRGDALAATVPTLPVPDVPELTGLAVGTIEDGTPLRIRLSGTQILVAGATGAGKGSVLWSLVASLTGGVSAGLVRLWVFDPKGGMEFATGRRLFDRFCCDDFTAMADALDQAVTILRERTVRLRGVTRQHTPTVGEPLYVIVIDELAALTAYLTDRHLKDRIKAALGLILTQGRAVGVHVIAAVQDPRKDVLPFRDLFPTRIALRLTEPPQADMVLGDGMRDRGAVCDRIPQTTPGVGYLVLDGDPTPVRARFSHWTDDAITTLAHNYGRLHAIPDHSSGEIVA
jgi:S-DNA-T family DNA segregation ATPase FtsK/SpoIIIE